MAKITYITPQFAVTGALTPADILEVAAAGFRSILSNLPDGESMRHPSSGKESALARAAGLGFRHVPTTKLEVLSDRVVEGVGAAAAELEGPILAHCASGLRSALAWAAAAARLQPAEHVLAALRSAGFSMDAMREELEALRDPSPGGPLPPALDATRRP
jgi:sulfide:quinone oxidoreductase